MKNWTSIILAFEVRSSIFMRFLKNIIRLPSKIAIGVVGVYQKTLSPDYSPFIKPLFPNGYCKYHPTCSQYSKESFKKHGFIIGLIKSTWRVLRCNPWSKGGADLP